MRQLVRVLQKNLQLHPLTSELLPRSFVREDYIESRTKISAKALQLALMLMWP